MTTKYENIEFHNIDEAWLAAAPDQEGLRKQLEWMNNGKFFGDPVVCHISPGSPQGPDKRNMYFEIRPKGGGPLYMNGAIFYHGEGTGWSIHT